MFDIGSSELLLIIIVAIVVIGPKDLPRALYKVGQVIGKAKGMARHFRSGVDAMIREAELEELQKQWAQENERIMAATMPDISGPDIGGEMRPKTDETVAQLPPPDMSPPELPGDTVPGDTLPDAPPSAAPVEEPGLPLDEPHAPAPRGSSVA